MLDKGTIAKTIVDRTLAEKLARAAKGDKRAAALLKAQQQARKAQAAAAQKKLHEFMTFAKAGGGVAANGKPVFNAMCLSCHTVGGQGAAFAPALDGSAHRDLEGLLTAILDPDAAVEGNYSLYRTYKKDGSMLEGYLEEENTRGVTLRFMGGGKVVVPRNEIANSGFVAGRSVMPAGLINAFGKQQVADLVAYIKTLK
jgi:putative heme-binding domain-containing protein